MGVKVEKTKINEGGQQVKPRDNLSMHYTGTLETENGKVFDSSRARDRPFEFQIGVGQVIKGWEEGVVQMKVGERAILTITPDYGYGARGHPPVIPPNSTLVFDVEVLGIKGKP